MGQVTEKGQVTIPIELRRKFGLLPHTEVEVVEKDGDVVVRAKEGYRMTFGNAMPQAMATLLAHRVEILNDMSGSDLKAHYMQLLANDARTERGGAGLGLYLSLIHI